MEARRVLVQSDWAAVLGKRPAEVWVGVREAGQPKSTFGTLRVAKDGTVSSDIADLGINQSPDGSLCIVHDGHKTVFLTPAKEYRLHKKKVNALSVSNSGLGASSDGEAVELWDIPSGSAQRRLEGHLLTVSAAAFFPSGLVLLSGGEDFGLRVFSVETAACARVLAGHTQRVTGLGFIGVGKEVISASRDGTCKVWNCGSGSVVVDACPEIGPLNAMAISDAFKDVESAVGFDGELVVALGSELGGVVLWDMSANAVVRTLSCGTGDSVEALGFVGAVVAAGTEGGRLRLFSAREDGGELAFLARGPVRCLQPLGTGLLLGFGDGSVVVVMRTETGEAAAVGELSGPEDGDGVSAIALNSKHVFTGARDGVVRRYSLNPILALIEMAD